VERKFAPDAIIVTKTDLHGRITYANQTFLDVAGYAEAGVLGQAHSIIRHPDMPRCVFKLLWDKLQSGNEVFAYVINLAKNGDHYWVFAHVTPTFDMAGNIIAYHSTRRCPEPAQVEAIKPLYAALLAEERKHSDRSAGMAASAALLSTLLAERQQSYEAFVFSL
jgi:PAS domain S-box-containing protein